MLPIKFSIEDNSVISTILKFIHYYHYGNTSQCHQTFVGFLLPCNTDSVQSVLYIPPLQMQVFQVYFAVKNSDFPP